MAVKQVPLSTFLDNVNAIYDSNPTYRQPGDGSDGTCDCIGLIIGAIRRSGGTWSGIHGTNYAVRQQIEEKLEIKSVNDLFVGEAVFKYTDDTKNLPANYKPGGKYYDGDLRDYYHVGVVMSVKPLQIKHMTSPHAMTDTKLGKWKVGGRLKKVDYLSIIDNGGASIMKGLYQAKVVTKSGSLNMRATTSTNSKIIAKIPQNTIITIYDDSASTGMYQTQYNGLVGYVSNKFLEKIDDSGYVSEVGIYLPVPADMVDIVLSVLHNATKTVG